MHNRQVVTFEVGGCGIAVANDFWSQMVSEHGLQIIAGGIAAGESSNDSLSGVSVFFDESRSGVYSPRTICCDLTCEVTDKLSRRRLLPYYDNKSLVFSNEGSGNCYAKAFHIEGLPVAQQGMNRFRRIVEACDSLQGVRFIHSLSGGTGSGLTGLLIRSVYDYLNAGSKCLIYSACVPPSNHTPDTCLSTYNTLLGLQDLIECSHMVFPYDNDAVLRQSKTTNCKSPNPFIAECLSGITASMRFPGFVNADLRKIYSNCVLFKNMHFLVSAFAKNMKSVHELTHQVFERNSATMSCDLLADRERSLASFMAFRGKCIPMSRVHESIKSLQLEDRNTVSASLCSQPVVTDKGFIPAALTCVHNTTAISQFFNTVLRSFDAQFSSRSHVYLYEENGLQRTELEHARNLVSSVSDLYREHQRN